MNRRVSIKDIAEAAGVSHSTVSRALHDRGRMGDGTRRRIRELAVEMGYTPDALARSLVSGRSLTVGVVVTTIADPFVVKIVEGIERRAHEAGYSVFLSSSHSDPDREIAVVETFRQRRVDAVIVTASRVGNLYTAMLAEFGAPIVLINNQHEAGYLHSVAADDIEGARLAVAHLANLGHQRIAYIGSSTRPISSQRRLHGYRQGLDAAGLSCDPRLAITPSHHEDLQAGRLGFEMLQDAAPTAMFAYNDMTAMGVMLAARARGLDIPTDLSLVGFDDVEFTQFLTPALTSVRQPKEDMGREAMSKVLSLLAGEETGDTLFPCELVVRASTSRPR